MIENGIPIMKIDLNHRKNHIFFLNFDTVHNHFEMVG